MFIQAGAGAGAGVTFLITGAGVKKMTPITSDLDTSGVQDPDLESNPAGYLDFFGFGLDIVFFSTGSGLSK